MRCEICSVPLVGDEEESQKLCMRCATQKAARAQRTSAPIPAVSSPAPSPQSQGGHGRPVHSGTVATGYTRTDPMAGNMSAPPPRKSQPTAGRRSDPAASTLKTLGGNVRSTKPTAASASSPKYKASPIIGDAGRRSDSLPRIAAKGRTSLPLPAEGDNGNGNYRRLTPVVQPSSVVMEGKYRLIDELGRGSMGTVFLAEDILLRRKVAVKFLLPELAHNTECSVRFKREAIAMASIRNENVAQIYSYGEDKGTPYFVMEYLEGQTVEELIDAYNRRGLFTPLKKAINIMVQVLSGVSAIHNANAVHRDIKPGNVMITTDPMRAVIMDFGLVRDVMVEDDMRTLAGTPAYIAPELVEGKAGASKSMLADVYSLGATFYELITGIIPFNGNSWVEILQKHIAEMPQFPSIVRPGLPEEFDDVILRAMSKEPNERFENCDVFLDALLRISSEEALQALPRFSRPPAAANSGGIANFARQSGGFARKSNNFARQSGGFAQKSDNVARQSTAPGQQRDSGAGFRRTPVPPKSTLLVADKDTRFRSEVYSCVKASAPDTLIHSASDGLMTMDLLKNIHPDVLVVNLALPEMNGFEIVASIVGEQNLKGTNVIVVSDSSNVKDAQLLKAMGVTHFWTKPVNPEAMLETMMPMLENPLRGY